MAYKNPTLIEIYVRFILAGGSLPQVKFFDIVPQLKKLGLQDVEMSTAINDTPGAEQTLVPRVRCWDVERLRLVQLSPDFFIVNQTKEYLGWSSYLNLIHNVQKAIQDSGIELRIESVELHTVDKLKVPRDDYMLGQWLNCNGSMIPRWYEQAVEACDLNLGLGLPRIDKRNRQLRVHVSPKDTEVEINFDSIFFQTFEATADVDKILAMLHNESNEMFEAVITDNVRNKVMGGEVST